MNTWAQNLVLFYKGLKPSATLPGNVEWLYPQKNPEVLRIAELFFQQYYNDDHQRTLLLGINPGRFGAGVTGINFTAPRQLTDYCGIEHSFKMQSELSAEFIYEVVNQYGGPKLFYANFFIGSISPLGFIKNGKNINYYDDKELLKQTEPFIIQNLEKLISFNVNRDSCFCIGGAKNFKYLSELNEKKQWFKKLIALPHPRFIMQYRRKQKTKYIQEYLQLLSNK
ncbi:MAG TPA: uracil-DNA glycosylase family protein [Flavisolibacter sp.]|nr:uracil-DNA glycosylase family protein [Flavisolibacter sp.]